MASIDTSLVKRDTPLTLESKGNAPIRDEILDSILPPREYEENGKLWIQYVSNAPATRQDVVALREALDKQLEARKVRNRLDKNIHECQCFDEIIRQVTVNCAERGMLLFHICNEIKMTVKAYETLFESGVAFGLRSTLSNEEKKQSLEKRCLDLQSKNDLLRSEVLEWKTRCAGVEKREAEWRELEAQRHSEEVEYLENYANQLKQQLEALTAQA